MNSNMSDRFLLNGAYMLHIHLEDCRRSSQCVVGYSRPGPERVFALGELYQDIISAAPHADLTKEIRWKDLQGDKITVSVNNQADWNEAVGELKLRQKKLEEQKKVKEPLNQTDLACLELFVKVNPLIKVRRVSVTVPTLQQLALRTIASLTPSDAAVSDLGLPNLLKSHVIATRNNKYADFVEGKFVIA